MIGSEAATKELIIDKSNWRKVQLGDVVKEVRETVKDPAAEGIDRIVGLEHLESENLHLTSWAELSDSTTFTKVFRKGQMLFGRRRAYLKKAAWATFDGICSGDITVLEARKDLIPELLPFLIQNDTFFDLAVKNSAGSLSPRAKFKDFADYEFLLPPKDQQEQLAELLWVADEVLQKDLEVLNNIEPLLKSVILNKIINQRGVADDRIKLKDIVEIKHGFPFKSEYWEEDDGNLPIAVTIGNYKYEGGFRFASTKIKCYSGDYPIEYNLMPNDLLLAMTCQTPGGEILGIPGMIEDDGRQYLHNQRIGKVIVNKVDQVLNKYLYLIFLSDDFRRFLLKSASGTKVLHTSPSKILDYMIPLPSIVEQQRLISEVESILQCEDHAKQKITHSSMLQKSLINQIF